MNLQKEFITLFATIYPQIDFDFDVFLSPHFNLLSQGWLVPLQTRLQTAMLVTRHTKGTTLLHSPATQATSLLVNPILHVLSVDNGPVHHLRAQVSEMIEVAHTTVMYAAN